MAITCKIACGGQPKCKLGVLTNHVQIYGEELSCVPTEVVSAPSKHKIMVILKSPDMKDTMSMGRGRNVDKLKDLLALATIDVRDVYVTGLVKCCPPRRDPSVQEIRSCMVHLADELRAVDPDVVILMGAATLRAFNLMGGGGVNALHGQIIKKRFPHDTTLEKEFNVVVSSDPNALFMNPDPRLQGTLVKDLIKAKAAVTGKLLQNNKAPTKYKLIKSMADLSWMVSNIQERGMFAFDSESRSLPWNKEPLICLQFCWGYEDGKTNVAVLPLYNHDPEGTDWKLKNTWSKTDREKVTQFLKVIFEDPNIPKIAHNIKYDMCVLRKHMGLKVNGFLFDTLLMHHLLWEHPPHDLEYLADIELDTGDYSKEVHKITGHGKELKNPYDHVPDEILHPYGAKDVECTYRLMCKYYSRMRDNPSLWSLYEDEVHPFIRTMMKAEWYGTKLDHNVIDALTEEFSKEREELLVKLKNFTWPEFNPDAHEDVMLCIKEAGFWKDIETPKTAKGYSTNREKLLKLVPKLPIVEDIMRFRTLTKLTGTYMKNAKKLANGDGRARISVLIHGTVNGRPSCSFLHQIPRLDHERIRKGLGNLRDMFIPNPGYSLVYGDYSQIELVIMAILSQDKEMMEIFRSGKDIHRATAAQFVGMRDEQVNEHNRSLAKPVNFSRVYGADSGHALLKLTWMDLDGKEHPVTEQMIKDGYAALDARFPGVATYFRNTVDTISANAGVHVTPFGRIKHMGTTLNSGNKGARENAERQAVNGTIQSPASAVTIRTLNAVNAALEDKIKKGEITEEDAFLVITVHDSGLWEVKNEHLEWFVPMVREIAMCPIPQLQNWQFKMKIGVGNSWTEAELNAN